MIDAEGDIRAGHRQPLHHVETCGIFGPRRAQELAASRDLVEQSFDPHARAGRKRGQPLPQQLAMLAYVSMPAYDPNSFSDGIGRTEWRMLSGDDHIPLLNKVAQGLYPSGSTIKPAMALAFLKQGIDPARRVHCAGGYQIGNRYFRCDAAHGD